MQATALVRIFPAGRVSRVALRALLQFARRVRQLEGFRRWRTFRAMDASDALLLVIECDTPAALEAALRLAEQHAVAPRVAGWGYTMSPVQLLSGTFDRNFTRQAGAASLLRVRDTHQPSEELERRESDLALHALAAPGSIGLSGARTEDGTTSVCRIDFDTEDGIWHFLDSPLRQMWSGWARRGAESETWALNLPRLEFQRPDAEPQNEAALEEGKNLSVQLTVSDDRHSAQIRLQGCVDGHGSRMCARFCKALIADGCLRLEVDVSGLERISPEALMMLTHTARRVKEQGGQFILTDNAARVRQVTRRKLLEASLR